MADPKLAVLAHDWYGTIWLLGVDGGRGIDKMQSQYTKKEHYGVKQHTLEDKLQNGVAIRDLAQE